MMLSESKYPFGSDSRATRPAKLVSTARYASGTGGLVTGTERCAPNASAAAICRSFTTNNLLPAQPLRVGLRLVDGGTLVKVRHGADHVSNVSPNSRHAIVGDVLRLVAHHVVVDIPCGGTEEYYGNSVTGIHVMIATTIRVGGISVLVELVIEAKRMFGPLVDRFGEISERGG